MLLRSQRRTGTTVVECAIIYPVFFLVVIGLIVGALGVFRYQQVASLAREAARYASVRGYKYSQVTGKPAATPQDVYDNVIKPKANTLDLSALTYEVTWNPDNVQESKVSVTVNYRWVPEAFFGGIDMSSTSTTIVAY
jgi:Flp pilus assembly protein TadG